MLSILIPIYNYDVKKLVYQLSRLAASLSIDYEILCFDDGSQYQFKMLNRLVVALPNVVYEELPSNLGRSRIRNLLGERAKYDHLLFMDCDSGVVNENYLNDYVKELPFEGVICGGRVYRENPPKERELYFHWKYGTQREVTTAHQRQQNPYHGFMSNNFVIDRKTFLAIQFDPELLQYGHEDTLFGMELDQRDIPIKHIDNPLRHDGLEPQDVFLEKTRKAVQNLVFLKRKHPLIATRLTRVAGLIEKKAVRKIVISLLTWAKPFIYKQISKQRASLKYFDFYKLLIFLEEKDKSK